jgi:hypothetical protein
MQQQLKADPSMQKVVDTHNDIANLDVDIVMDDAPDTVTQEVEDFQAMAEMVKSGFPLPPEAVIMSSPLGNKDKILKMMKERPQMPPEAQKQMEQMSKQLQTTQQEAKKLADQNQQLRMSQAEAQAKIASETQLEQQRMQMEAAAKEREGRFQAMLDAADARRDADFQRWKALLDARTKVEVAEINKAATIETSQITAAKEATA